MQEKREQKSLEKSKLFQRKDEEGPGRQLESFYRDDWTDLVDFKCDDAADGNFLYVDNDGQDITHIYSYNKVMSVKNME